MEKVKSTRLSGNAKIVLRVSIIGIAVNIFLTIIKLVVGLMFDNLAVVSDAIHSATDFLTSIMIMVTVFISSPQRDKKHHYGREKFEPLTILFLSLFLFGVGAYLAWQAVEGILSPQAAGLNWYLIGVIVISILCKEALYYYGMHHAKKINSDMLKADAWHSRSDSLTSVAVLIGLISSIFIGINIIESIAVLVVSFFIFKVAYSIFKPAIDQLTDRSAGKETHDQIRGITMSVDGVKKIDDLRTRMFGNRIYVDLNIAVDGTLTVEQSHDIAQAVHDILEATPDLHIKHCMVHVNPYKED